MMGTSGLTTVVAAHNMLKSILYMTKETKQNKNKTMPLQRQKQLKIYFEMSNVEDY